MDSFCPILIDATRSLKSRGGVQIDTAEGNASRLLSVWRASGAVPPENDTCTILSIKSMELEPCRVVPIDLTCIRGVATPD